MRRFLLSAAVVLAAASVVTVLLQGDPMMALGIAGAFVIVSMYGLSQRAPRALSVRAYRWVPFAWLVLLVVSNHQLDPDRSPLEAAQGLASMQNIVELSAYGLIATFVGMTWHFRNEPAADRVGPGPLVVLPVVATASAVWSVIPLFSLLRALQLAVPLALAVLMARLWVADPEVGRELWRRTCRILLAAVVILVAYGWATSGTGSAEHAGRFTWPMMHPVHAGLFIGAALLVLVVGGRAFVRLPTSVHWAVVALLGISLVLTRTRVALAAFLVAFALSLLLPPRRDPAARYVGIVWLVGAAVVTWALAGDALLGYLARGDSSDVFTTLNGRVPLWNVAFDELAAESRWLTGFGFGSARVILFERVPWAGTAHNAWVELAVGVGLLGSLAIAVAIVSVAARTVIAALERSLVEMRLAAALAVFLIVASMTTSELVIPGFDFSLLSIVAAATIAVTERVQARVPVARSVAA